MLIALLLFADEPTLRGLCIRADAVALARPLDPVAPTRFKVTEILRGKPGEVIDTGLSPEAMRSFGNPDFEKGGKPQPNRSEAALVFLREGKLLGLRLCTENGRVLAWEGGKIVAREGRWAEIVQRVRLDVAAVDHLRNCRALSPSRKGAALASWIERHRASLGVFAASSSDESPGGWEELGTAVFDWMMEDEPASAWQAIRLYASLHAGELLRPRSKVFEGEAGQAFLLKQAQDKAALAGDRARAIALLNRSEGVAALLADDAVTLAAIAALVRLGKTGEAVKELEEVHRSAKPGPVREEAAWAMSGHMAAAKWKEMTGNPPGVAVALREVEWDGSEAALWLHVNGGKVHEPPVLVLETLNPLGIVTETKKQALDLVFVPHEWKDGWDGGAPLAAKLSLASYPAGARVRWRVEGTVGKAVWKSEPRIVKVPQPRTNQR